MPKRLLLAALLLTAACDLLLPPLDFEPTGTTFSLNPQIAPPVTAGSLRNFSPVGSVTLDMTCRSTGSGPVAETLPAGLLLRSRRSSVQHLLVVKPHPFVAGTSPTEVVVGSFCCNEARSIPDYEDTFDLGPLTDNSGLQQIVSIVSSRDITGNLTLVANAVTEVTSRGSLPDAYVDSLNALPADTL
jgi:hypothetical protein